MRAETFLSMYRVLEGLLGEKYSGSDHKSQSVIMQYIQDAESEPVRRQLDVCREVRNILTHNADTDGKPLVEPSQALLDQLYDIIKYVQTPQSVLMYATRIDSMLRAYPNDRVMDVMRRMEKRGISHVPVMNDDRITGVFSAYSVFARTLAGKCVDQNTRMKEFGDHLSLDNRRYLILSPDASYLDARNEFEKKHDRNRRLAAIFITDTGDITGALLGILAPSDVMRDTPD